MTLGRFGYFFMIVVAVNLIAVQIEIPLEKLFGIIGVSAKSGGVENVGASAAFLIYACVLGPFLEEVIYRGRFLGL